MVRVHESSIKRIDASLKSQPDQHLDFLVKKSVIEKILYLKEKKNVLILGHNYMEPLIFQLSEKNEGGDSLALSQMAARSNKPIILFNGVRFMAETAKILNPGKKVLISDLEAGCSLADPFTAEDVVAYKLKFPDAPVVTYINSYVEVKAESDYCCTSSNCLKVVKYAAKEAKTNRVIFFPDSFMGKNIQNELKQEGTSIEIIYPGKYDDKFGKCEVHEKFTAEQIREIREQHKIPKSSEDSAVLVHWECKPEVLKEADFFGSTSQMANYIKENPRLKKVYLATECEMAANLASEFPQVEFIRSCSIFCEHMRRITLEKILYSLENEVYEIEVNPSLRKRALAPIKRMLAIK